MFFFKKNKTEFRNVDRAEDKVKVSLKRLVKLAQTASVIDLHQSPKRTMQSGNYVSRFKGRGMEFDEVRLYQPGDDVKTIDWRVTARTGKTHTKLFREERERPVFISVDNRATMEFATRGVFKSVQASYLAGLIAWAAHQHSDRIGGQIFTDSACVELKPQHGRYSVLRFLHALVNPETNENAEVTIEHSLKRLKQHAKPGSLVYIISDFRGLNLHAENHLRRLAEHCQVVLIMIYDILESELPPDGRYRFTNDKKDIVVDTTEKERVKLYQQRFKTHVQRLEGIAKKFHMTFLQCSTVDDPIKVLV